jgi:EAL domain-containing protein (putative c-di-GMP-specific phosphodiesterase class I)
VLDMTTGPTGLSLLSTIISLAHSMSLKAVAEGVETEDQSRVLRMLHCDEMQGFLIGRALPKAQFEAKFLASDAE